MTPISITLALLFSLTDNFDLNLEYSHTDNDGGNDDDEFYLQALLHLLIELKSS